eukprot:TRINITY_DN5945_c0_g1_i2.p1 TRINITY_DN5945_c0_g1~~TRINITY_DN5945_c0_g1_i2.p1  ORF type:complete len:210 (+),score=26.80 TRINITY_DN5945_c0_g1_i2:106-735(+)
MMLCQLEHLQPSRQPDAVLADGDPEMSDQVSISLCHGREQDVMLWKDFARDVSTKFPSDDSSRKLEITDCDFERAVSRESGISPFSQMSTTSGASQFCMARGRLGKRLMSKICAAMTPRTPEGASWGDRVRAGWMLRRRRLARSLSLPRQYSGDTQKLPHCGDRSGDGCGKWSKKSALASRRGIGPISVEVPARSWPRRRQQHRQRVGR